MSYDLNKSKQQVDYLDKLRTERALSGTSGEFQQVFQTFSLLLHINHPSLPSYIEHSPQGIANFTLSSYQQNYLSSKLDAIELIQHQAMQEEQESADILGIYVMGSIASITQTAISDLDIWVCHKQELSSEQRQLLNQKTALLQQWALSLGISISIYLMDPNRFRSFRYAEPLTAENCGSAQYMLLLDEFYRSAIRLAGKPLLWLHLPVEKEEDYEAEVARLIANQQINPDDWVDFGGLGAFSANEYFGASLWQLYKGIDAPYKSVLKILLLEIYSSQYPHTYLIAQEFKQRLLAGELNYHFDAYLNMLERVTQYLINAKEFKRLTFVRHCFYMKASNYGNQTKQPNWRLEQLAKLASTWGWSKQSIAELEQSSSWKIKKSKTRSQRIN